MHDIPRKDRDDADDVDEDEVAEVSGGVGDNQDRYIDPWEPVFDPYPTNPGPMTDGDPLINPLTE